VRLFDRNFKHTQIQLVNDPQIGDAAAHEAVVLTVVQGKVLHGYAYALTLHTLDFCRCQLTGQQGIFGKILKVSAAKGIALDVCSRAKQNVHAVIFAFLGNGFTHFPQVFRIPAGSCGDGSGKCGGRFTAGNAVVARFLLHAKTVRPVRHS